jgi:hypothetical protein
MSQTEGRDLADVTTYMQETLDSLATNRVTSKMRTDFQNDFVAASKMKIIERLDGSFQLYPKVTWAGTLKTQPPRDLRAILQETVEDLATWWQADLVNRGYTIVRFKVTQYANP